MPADTVTLELDGFEIAADDPLRGAHERLGEFLAQVRPTASPPVSESPDEGPLPKDLAAGRAILKSPPARRAEVAAAIPARRAWLARVKCTGGLSEQEHAALNESQAELELAAHEVRAADPRVGLVHMVMDRLRGEPRFAELRRLRARRDEHIAHLTSPAGPARAVEILLADLLRKPLPLDAPGLAAVAGAVGGGAYARDHDAPLAGLVKQAEAYDKKHGLTDALRTALRPAAKLGRRLHRTYADRTALKHAERLEALVTVAPKVPLDPGEPWADAVRSEVADGAVGPIDAWVVLLIHCRTATGGKPSKKWADAARPLADAVGRDRFAAAVARWFVLVEKPRDADRPGGMRVHTHATPWRWFISDANADSLKGLAWCCGLSENPALARALTRLALASYKKVPGVGARLTKLGNACVWALGHMPGTDAVGQLALLAVKVKFGTAQKQIEKALTAAADREGLPRDEIEELAVPTYGLTLTDDGGVGVREETLGDFTARINVAGTGSAKLSFFDRTGKERKSVPAAVKRDFPDALKELKAAAKDVQKMLPAQRDRIDSLFLARKSWPLKTWRERYWDHPLVGTLARRLIWRFGSGPSPQADGSAVAVNNPAIVDAEGAPIDVPEDATVTLWHPIEEPKGAVLAWRRFYEDRGISQPFKQAHREIYVLTDAERNTGVYSNRFAAQLVKQHQFKALGEVRGWKSQLRLMVDDDYPPPSKQLPAFGLRAEYWVEGAGEEYGRDTNETGTYLHLATDQIRFYPIDAETSYAHASGGGYGRGWNQAREPDPVPLEEVPALALSEILRDADLFVGVAGVGNDPTWADGATVGENRYDRWHDYSFGDLTATAATRKAVLERLVPRLKIADRCDFTDRFLRVRGEWRTYKIHLGSGNVLMEPNDRYLCIVPRAGAAAGPAVSLPFEGDRTLSVILSKAFLLADDLTIKDPTIVSQIEA